MNLRIATRESPLALWQAHHVQSRLRAAHPGLNVTLVPMTTQGDRLLGTPLSAVGGKGLFVKELEQCMLEGHADIAVHSMKDVPAEQPPGLCLQAFLDGEDPRDAFVSNEHDSLAALPAGSRVGTSSLRRQAQLRALRPDLQIEELRGNVGTRLRKLDEGQYAAILLAAAGLIRLDLSARIRERLDVQRMLPAIGQGIVGIECRSDDAATHALLAPLHDPASAIRLTAERAMNSRLGGACQVPVAGHATLAGDRLRLEGMVASVDGSQVIRDHIEGQTQDAEVLGATLAGRLLDAGGAAILRALGIAV